MVQAEVEERATDRINEADGFVLLPDPEVGPVSAAVIRWFREPLLDLNDGMVRDRIRCDEECELLESTADRQAPHCGGDFVCGQPRDAISGGGSRTHG